MQTDPDIQLMRDFKEGNVNAFQQLFDGYKKRVINYCYRFSGDQAVAEELAQETFIKVYQGAKRYRPKAKFSTWLFKIATNVCLNELRKPVYRNRIESIDHLEMNEGSEIPDKNGCAADKNLENSETQLVVRNAIKMLPEKQRAAILLRIEEEFSYKEIGKQIGCRENHVKVLIHRARENIKAILAQGKKENATNM